jgi:hypothetical protein
MLNSEQQLQLISQWIADTNLFARTISIVKPQYFDPEYRKAIAFILQYNTDYNGIPTPSMIQTETGIVIPSVTLTRDQIKFNTDRLELFCKQSALRLIIIEKSPDLIINNKLGELETLVRDAISIRVDSNTGISFFDKIEERSGHESQVQRFSTGYPDLDAKMDGGVARTEMLLMLAISGGGKSVSILNFGLNLIKQKENGKYLNCLCVSLELSEEMFDKRTQMIVSDKSSFDVSRNVEDIQAIVNAQSEFHGDLIIKKMRLGTTANDIRGLIKEIQIKNGYTPDVIVLDYLDKCYPIQKVSTENIGTRDKFITEEFIDLLMEFDMIGLTASQLTKSAATVEVYDQSHQAGGAEKIRSSDWCLAIHLTDAMRAAGQIGFQFLKTRSSDGVGSIVNLGWKPKSLKIFNPRDKQTSSSSGSQSSVIVKRKSLSGLFDLT